MSDSVVELTSFVKELSKSALTRSVLISDIPDVVVNIVDKIEIYFGKRSNGGGDIENVTLLGKHFAVITFCDDGVVPSVLKNNPHQFYGGYKVQVKPLELCVDELNGQQTASEPKTAGRQSASAPRPVEKVDLFETVQVTISTEQHPYILDDDLIFVRRLSRELDLTITITKREKILKFEGNWNAIHSFRSQLKEKYNLDEEDDYEETRGLRDKFKENIDYSKSATRKGLKKNTHFDDSEESKEDVAAISRRRHTKESHDVHQDMWNEEAAERAHKREDKKTYLKETSLSERNLNQREKGNGVGSRTPDFDEERHGMSSTLNHETWEDKSEENHWPPLGRSSSTGESAFNQISPKSTYNQISSHSTYSQTISSQPKPYSQIYRQSTRHPTTSYLHNYNQPPSTGNASYPAVSYPYLTTYPSATNKSNSYTFLPFKLQVNNFLITVKVGDITNERVDTIVSSIDSNVSTPIIGLAGAIMAAGGDKVKGEWKSRNYGAKEGDILMLGSGRLPCQRIMFVVMSVCTLITTQEQLLKMTPICGKVLKNLNGVGAKSAAITGLGTGKFGYPSGIFVRAMLTALRSELLGGGSHMTALQEIVFVDKNSSLLQELATAIRFDFVK